MDEVMSYSNINTFAELTDAICGELCKAAISFVRIGYLLKRARDEDILKDTGFSDIYEYANAKFGLDKSQVSRFININDRYSIGGYSEHLKVEYEEYGYSKLALMLTLPDEINEELSPQYTKTEINVIKAEYEAEQKISDMEVMMEEKEDGPDEFVAMIVKELNDEHPDAAIYLNDTMKLAAKMGIIVNDADIMEAYIPDGVATYSIRIPGQGRFMVSMKPEGITILNMRDPENKSPLSWQEFKDILMEDMKVRDFPKETKKPEKKKTEKVKPAKPKTDMGKTIVAVEKEALDSSVAPVQQEEKVEETAKTQNEAVPERIPEEDTEIIPAEHSTDNVPPEDIQEVEEDIQEDEDTEPAAGEESKAAAGEKEDDLTSAQKDMLEWLELLKRKTVPEDGSRPDWAGILDEVKTMERFVKQFTY